MNRRVPRRVIAANERAAADRAYSGQQRREVFDPIATQSFYLSPRMKEANAGGFTQPYRQHGWIYSAVYLNATNVAGVPWRAKNGVRNGDSKTLESGPWYELLESPNPAMSAMEMRETIETLLELRGEVLLIKEGPNDEIIGRGEIPSELWPVDGKLAEHVIDPKTKLITHWIFRVQGKPPLTLPAHAVCQIKFYNPYDPYRGLAPLDAAERVARNDTKSEQYEEAYYDNDATPGGILVSQGPLTPEQRQDITESWNSRHAGVSKKFRMALLEGGLSWQQMGEGPKGADMQPKREWNREQIAAIFGVPVSEMVGEEAGSMVTGQGVSLRDRNYWTKRLKPKMRRIEEAMTNGIVRITGDKATFIEFAYETIEALQEARDSKINSAKELRNLGWSINEVNESMGLNMPDLKDIGDLHLVPSGMQPLEALSLDLEKIEEDEAPAGEQVPAEPVDEDEQPMPLSMDEEDEGGHDEDGGDEGGDERIAQHRHRIETFLRDRKEDRDAVWLRAVKTSMAPYEPKFRGRWKKFLFEMASATLRELKKQDSRAMDQSAVPDEKTWGVKLKNLTRPVYGQVITASLKNAFSELGGGFAFDVVDPRVVDIVEQRQKILVAASLKVQKAAARQIEEGVRAGETIQEVAARVKTVFKFGAARSLTVARTEVASATNMARFVAMNEEEVEEHEWVTSRDEVVRESHAAQEGVVIKVGAEFENGLKYPNDPSGEPGEVINCRCVTAPVVK